MTIPYHYNPKQIDPALMTFSEYMDVIDEDRKSHPSSAYDVSLKQLNNNFDISKFKVFRQKRINNIQFRFMIKTERFNVVKTKKDGEIVRDENGNAEYFTQEELDKLGKRNIEWMVAVVNEDGERVASIQDEWGTVLIMVAQEYRGFGLGEMIGKIAYEIEPSKASGGMTPKGRATMIKVYREFVRDALKNGKYREQVKSGNMTIDRVKDIVNSAGLEERKKRKERNMRSDPDDWMLYGEYGGFVLYDKKLKDHMEDDPYGYWTERMIKGYVLVRIPGEWGYGKRQYGIVVRFGGDTIIQKRFLLNVAMAWCHNEGVDFAVDMDDLPLLRTSDYEAVGEPSNATGAMRQIVRPTNPVDYSGLLRAERRYRKSFDEYDEFKNEMISQAEAKYRDQSLNESFSKPNVKKALKEISKIDFAGLEFDYFDVHDDIHISWMMNNSAIKGAALSRLKDITEIADRNNVRLTLQLDHYHEDGDFLDNPLGKRYKSLGFDEYDRQNHGEYVSVYMERKSENILENMYECDKVISEMNDICITEIQKSDFDDDAASEKYLDNIDLSYYQKVSKDTFEIWKRKSPSIQDVSFIFVYDDIPVGFADTDETYYTDLRKNVVSVSFIWVSPEYRRMKVAEKFYRFLLEAGRVIRSDNSQTNNMIELWRKLTNEYRSFLYKDDKVLKLQNFEDAYKDKNTDILIYPSKKLNESLEENYIDDRVRDVKDFVSGMKVIKNVFGNPDYCEKVTFLLKKNIKNLLKQSPKIIKDIVIKTFPNGRGKKDFLKALFLTFLLMSSKSRKTAIDETNKEIIIDYIMNSANMVDVTTIHSFLKIIELSNEIFFNTLNLINKKLTENLNESILIEGLSDVLFHSTGFTAAHSILKSDSFRLTPDIASDLEMKFRKRNKFYFMSFSRNRINDFRLSNESDVTFVIDGRKLKTDGFSGKPINFFNDDEYEDDDEMEDRLFHSKPFIRNASKYIKEIHTYVNSNIISGRTQSYLRQIYIFSKKLGIPIYFYENRESFMHMDRRYSVNLSSIDFEKDTMPFPKGRTDINKKMFDGFTELLLVKDEEKLSNKAKELLNNIRQYTKSVINSLYSEVDGASYRSELRPELDKFLEKARRLNLYKLDDIVFYIQDKFSKQLAESEGKVRIVNSAWMDKKTGEVFGISATHADAYYDPEVARKFGFQEGDIDAAAEALLSRVETGEVVDGFVDQNGNFYDRDEAKKFVTITEPEHRDFVDSIDIIEDENVFTWNEKNIVWTNGQFYIALDDLEDPSYVSVWTDDNKKIGQLTTGGSKSGYKKMDSADIDKKYRGNRLGLLMYQMFLRHLNPKYKGIASYLPNQINKKQMPKIYRKLGGYHPDGNEDWLFVDR